MRCEVINGKKKYHKCGEKLFYNLNQAVTADEISTFHRIASNFNTKKNIYIVLKVDLELFSSTDSIL